MKKKLKPWSPDSLKLLYDFTFGSEDYEHYSHKVIPALYRLGNFIDMEQAWNKLSSTPNLKNFSKEDLQLWVVFEVFGIINKIFFNTKTLTPQDKKKKIEKINKQISKLTKLIMTDVDTYRIALEQDFLEHLLEFSKSQNTYADYSNNYIQSDRATLIRDLYDFFYKTYGSYLSDCVVSFTNSILDLNLGIEDVTPYKPKEKNS